MRQQAAAMGFDDDMIYVELEKDLIEHSIPMHCIMVREAVEVFTA